MNRRVLGGTGLLFIAWLVVSLLAIVFPKWLSPTGEIEARALENHEKASQLPLELFREDRQCVVSGRVTNRKGAPLAGVRVRLHDEYSLLLGVGRGLPGRWWTPDPQAECETNARGEFFIHKPSYGSKFILFDAKGYLPSVRSGLTVQDGVGAADVDAVLDAGQDGRVSFIDAMGRPVEQLVVRILPATFGQEIVTVTTDTAGRISVPRRTRSAGTEPHFLLGSPGFLAPCPDLDDDPAIVTVPDRGPFVAQLDGSVDGPVEFTFLPAGARRAGWETFEMTCEAGVVRHESLWCAPSEILIRQNGRCALLRFTHDGTPQQAVLTEPVDRRVTLRDPRGAELKGVVVWQSVPFDSTSSLRPTPLAAMESQDPLGRQAAVNASGEVRLDAVPSVEGWLLAESPGFAPHLQPVDSSTVELEIILHQGVQGSLQTSSPYALVSVEARGQPRQLGQSDAFQEVFFRAREGPVVLHAGYPDGGVSYPVGQWLGLDVPTPVLTRSYEHSGSGGCVYGFVTDPSGRPVNEVEVVLRSARVPLHVQLTDASGYFLFRELFVGEYEIFCRAPQDQSAIPITRKVIVPDVNGAQVRQSRSDLVLWPGGLELRVDSVLEPVELRLGTETGEWLCSVSPDAEGRFRMHGIPVGTYVLNFHDAAGAQGLDLPLLVIGPDTEGVLQWTVSREGEQ